MLHCCTAAGETTLWLMTDVGMKAEKCLAWFWVYIYIYRYIPVAIRILYKSLFVNMWQQQTGRRQNIQRER